jgi:glycosyltransferase involved in cell wall biosynthesis
MEDAIMAVWRDETLRDDMRRRGLARAAQFSWERAADETLAVYATTN